MCLHVFFEGLKSMLMLANMFGGCHLVFQVEIAGLFLKIHVIK